jgi:hypothetical protein
MRANSAEYHAMMRQLASMMDRGMDEAGKDIKWAKSILDKTTLDLKDPVMFNCFVRDRIDAKADTLFHMQHMDKMPSNVFYTLQFIYLKYDFIEAHLKCLIDRFEGAPYGDDRVKTIVRMAVKMVRSGTLSDVNDSLNPSWYVPNHLGLWIKMVIALWDLYYGDAKNYLRVRDELRAAYETAED